MFPYSLVWGVAIGAAEYWISSANRDKDPAPEREQERRYEAVKTGVWGAILAAFLLPGRR